MTHIKLPKVILFDWDGTLANTYHLLEQAHNHVHEQLGLDVKADGWYQDYFGMSRIKIFSMLYGEAPNAQKIFMNFVHENNARLISSMEHSEQALQALNDMGIICCIVTNKPIDFAMEEITEFGWASFFKTVVGGDESDNYKPAKDPLELALKRISYRGDIGDVWMVGDTVNDQLAAKNMGCHFVAYYGDVLLDVDEGLYKPLFSYKNYNDFVANVREFE